jgi:hypothetical protein
VQGLLEVRFQDLLEDRLQGLLEVRFQGLSVWASWRHYTYIEGPPELGAPEKLTFRWNHAYLAQNCAKNAIPNEKVLGKANHGCMTAFFF